MNDINQFVGNIRRCVQDYNMINDGDKIAVGVSGGKDSLALLFALSKLREYFPYHFSLTALTVDMGFDNVDFLPVKSFCSEIGVEYHVKKTELKSVIFDYREEKNPCALCSKMRRGILHDMMHEYGLNKIALGHHFDDVCETFLMSLLYEGRINCFQPVTYMSRTKVTQIRPMVYIGENSIRAIAEKFSLPVVKSKCPMDKDSKRAEIKALLSSLEKTYPDVKTKIFGSIQRMPLDGWKTFR